jgi:hypothetical protein
MEKESALLNEELLSAASEVLLTVDSIHCKGSSSLFQTECTNSQTSMCDAFFPPAWINSVKILSIPGNLFLFNHLSQFQSHQN